MEGNGGFRVRLVFVEGWYVGILVVVYIGEGGIWEVVVERVVVGNGIMVEVGYGGG